MNHFKRIPRSFYIKLGVIAVWLTIWQFIAMIIGNSLVLTSPWQAIKALGEMSGEASFWASIWGSFYHIALGFFLASIVGIILSIFSYKSRIIEEFLSFPMMVFKTVPVASFIILLLISLKTKDNLSTIICFMMSLPVIYTNTLAGLKSTDPKMLEMADVFRISHTKRFAYLYAYKTLPFFATGAKLALGLCWKSGVAAELIGLVQHTIGNELYYARLYLLMDYVFAWTIVIMAISLLFEVLVLGLLKLTKRRLER